MTISPKSRILYLAAIAVLISLIILTVLLTSFLSAAYRSQVEHSLSQLILRQSGYSFSFARLRLSLFPLPKIHFEEVVLEDPKKEPAAAVLRAERLTVEPRFLPLLFKRVDLASLALQKAGFQIPLGRPGSSGAPVISAEDFFITLRAERPGKPIHFEARGRLLSGKENVTASGTIRMDLDRASFTEAAVQANVSLGPLEIREAVRSWNLNPIEFQTGEIAFQGTFSKEAGKLKMNSKGRAAVKDVSYRLAGEKDRQSAAADYGLSVEAAMDFVTGNLAVTEARITSPFGSPLSVSGRGNWFRRDLEEVIAHSDSVDLGLLPQYLLWFEKISPLLPGLSGISNFDFFMKGKPEARSLNVRIDLTDAALSHPRYFTKPQGVPLHFKSSLALTGPVLKGDFGAEFKDASLKGSVAELNLESGSGKATILTNKFQVSGWEAYFPMLKRFRLSGAAKVFANVDGNVRHLSESQVMANVSLDHVSAQVDNGPSFSDVSGNIDLGPMDSEIKDLQFALGRSHFSLQGKMFSQPNPKQLLELHSKQIDIHDFAGELRLLAEIVDYKKVRIDWLAIEKWAAQHVSAGAIVEDLRAQIALDGNRLMIPQFEFGFLNGQVSAQALIDVSGAEPVCHFRLNAARIPLEKLAGGRRVAAGNLFGEVEVEAAGPFDNGWMNRLKGGGTFSITNGELYTLNVLGALSKIAGLATLGKFDSGTTRFHDLSGEIRLEENKWEGNNLILISDDLYGEGSGSVDWGGNVNGKFSVYVSNALSRHVSSKIGADYKLGPIPLLVAGTLEQSLVKTDPMRIESFLTDLIQGEFLKITTKILPTLRRKVWVFPAGAKHDPASSGGTEGPAKESEPQTGFQKKFAESGFGVLEQFVGGGSASS